MSLSYRGRIETRLFTTVVIGIPLGILFGIPFIVALMFIIGTLWDGFYTSLQNRRWEGDWPTAFSLFGIIIEGLFLFLFLRIFFILSVGSFFDTYLFITSVMFIFQLSLLNCFFPYRKFYGGRIF